MAGRIRQGLTEPDRRARVLDVLIAACTTGIEIGVMIDRWPDWTWTAIALSALAGGALVFRRRAPVVVLVLTTALAGLVVLLSGAGGVARGAPPVVALFTLGERKTWRVALLGLVPAAVLLFAWSITSPVVCVMAVLTGRYLQMRRRYVSTLEERTAYLERERAQLDQIAMQRERAAVARELHDLVGHTVTVMLLGVRGARDVLRTAPDEADDTLRRVEESGEQSLAELRRIVTVLRDVDTPTASAPLRPAPSLKQVDELVTTFRDLGLPIRLDIDGALRPLPDGVELAAYRILEEALTNVLKHSRATEVLVQLRYGPEELEVRVDNDGQPRLAPETVPARGHGIIGMQERAAAHDGQVTADVRPGGGFRVRARLPIGATV
ncbi:histidine kinase [Nocardioides endophyticus]|uniref:histidine kinase n=1 Tax=Nocardioides endophyticus TaxID=1353775 RepID=A0ABP8Z667_9ACTN